MPWTPKDSKRHTHKVKSTVAQRQWAHVANSALKRGQSEGTAIREANGVVKRRGFAEGGSSPLAEAINSGGPYLGRMGHSSIDSGPSMYFAHARARMPYIPIADQMRNVDKMVINSKAKLGKMSRPKAPTSITKGIKTKFADGGMAELAQIFSDPEAQRAVTGALNRIKGGDHSGAAALLRSSKSAMRHPMVARAADRLRTADGLSPATIDLQRFVKLTGRGQTTGDESGEGAEQA